jgi:fluoride ion exporter CrcB/FEX
MRPNITLTPRQFTVALLAVASGGAVGTLLRDLLLKIHTPPLTVRGWTAHASTPPPVSWTHFIPWVLLSINFLGAYLATRALRGPLKGHDPNDPMRLLVITGLFGGFTSYSGLFVDFDVLWHHSIGGCLFVAVMAVLSGVAAAELGLKKWPR